MPFPIWTVKSGEAFDKAVRMPRGWRRRVFFQDEIHRLNRHGDLANFQAEDILAFGNEVL